MIDYVVADYTNIVAHIKSQKIGRPTHRRFPVVLANAQHRIILGAERHGPSLKSTITLDKSRSVDRNAG
jgi:hypothetical protein